MINLFNPGISLESVSIAYMNMPNEPVENWFDLLKQIHAVERDARLSREYDEIMREQMMNLLYESSDDYDKYD